MAKTETPAPAPAPVFVAKPLAELPKRAAPVREFDRATADAIYAIISNVGTTATDGAVYPDEKTARATAAKYRRMVQHVTPETFDVKTKVYAEGDGFAWSLYLAPHKARKPRTPKVAATA